MTRLSPQESRNKQLKDEIDILKRFVSGKKVENEEVEVVKKYATIGITHLGFSFTKREIQASLTKNGIGLLGLFETEKGQEK